MTLNITLDEKDLRDIYRTFHPKTAKYTFFYFQVHIGNSPGSHVRPQNKHQ